MYIVQSSEYRKRKKKTKKTVPYYPSHQGRSGVPEEMGDPVQAGHLPEEWRVTYWQIHNSAGEAAG